MKRVKCIDPSDRKGKKGGAPPLVMGEIYTVETEYGDSYTLAGLSSHHPYANRFVVIPENACPQCGEVHP
jgi:hypothetical protein